jgi:hypothetical protein
MKKLLVYGLIIGILGFVACGEEKKEEIAVSENYAQPPGGAAHTVKVVDFLDASQYTYIEVEEAGNKYWIAAPQMTVQKGDILHFDQGMEMKDFHSNSLNRTFDMVLFVERVQKNLDAEQPMSHPKIDAPHGATQDRAEIQIEPVSGGKTVSQVYAEKNSLSGKTIKLKGKVIKFNAEIMDRNWIHIQDGTGGKDDYDLLVTSDEVVQVGDVVIVEGVVAVNRDFGSGYTYPVMVEKAKITKAGNGKTKI